MGLGREKQYSVLSNICYVSEKTPVTWFALMSSGVPQGSVLGPFPFHHNMTGLQSDISPYLY